MSSKLVKKQLSSVLAGTIEKSRKNPASQQAPAKPKRRQRKPKNGGKGAVSKGSNAEAVRAANLQYFKQTTRPSAATQDLLAQALRVCGGTAAAVEQPQDDDDFGDDDLFF